MCAQDRYKSLRREAGTSVVLTGVLRRSGGALARAPCCQLAEVSTVNQLSCNTMNTAEIGAACVIGADMLFLHICKTSATLVVQGD